jgi:hypothetical protein
MWEVKYTHIDTKNHMGKFWDQIILMFKAGKHLTQCCPKWALLGSSEFEHQTEEDLKWKKFNTDH